MSNEKFLLLKNLNGKQLHVASLKQPENITPFRVSTIHIDDVI